MKEVALVAVFLLTVMLGIPILNLKDPSPTTEIQIMADNIEDPNFTVEPKGDLKFYDSFRIKITETGAIENISASDYIFGVVSAEMPALYESDALKAQAVAAYTFACRRKAVAKGDYDLTDSPQTDQCYISREQALQRWGSKAEEYENKVKSAVEDVKGYILTYNGTAALTVYHAISSGTTERCADVWGSDLPYLTNVESAYDKLAKQYLSEKSFSPEGLKAALSGVAELSGEAQNWFGEAQTTKTGRVKSISLCGKDVSGSDISKALELRSTCFEINLKDGSFIFTTRGYGHGVGMSQNGADYMAKQGADYKEILSHYYPGCKLERAEN